jgi:hypothetical protein
MQIEVKKLCSFMFHPHAITSFLSSCDKIQVVIVSKMIHMHGAKIALKLRDYADIGRYNIIDIISYHYITFSRILIFLYHFLKGDIFVI